MLINKFMPGVGPHWLSDGGGEVGVYITHKNAIRINNIRSNRGGYFIYEKSLMKIK